MRISDWSSDVCSFDIGIALASAQCAIRHWREGGSAAAPAYQHAFARQMRRPIAVAELVSGLARHPVSTTLALSLLACFPGALRLLPAAPRISTRTQEERRLGKECVSRCKNR